jgi:hypothetical protein
MIEILAKDMEVDLDDLDEYETEDERKYTLAFRVLRLQHKWCLCW